MLFYPTLKYRTNITSEEDILYIAFGCLVSVTLYHGLCDAVL